MLPALALFPLNNLIMSQVSPVWCLVSKKGERGFLLPLYFCVVMILMDSSSGVIILHFKCSNKDFQCLVPLHSMRVTALKI